MNYLRNLKVSRNRAGDNAEPSNTQNNLAQYETLRTLWHDYEHSKSQDKNALHDKVITEFCRIFPEPSMEEFPQHRPSFETITGDLTSFSNAVCSRMVTCVTMATKQCPSPLNAAAVCVRLLSEGTSGYPTAPLLLQTIDVICSEMIQCHNIQRSGIASCFAKLLALLQHASSQQSQQFHISHANQEQVSDRVIRIMCRLATHAGHVQEMLETSTLGFLLLAALPDDDSANNTMEVMVFRMRAASVLRCLFSATFPDAVHAQLKTLLQTKGVFNQMLTKIRNSYTTLPVDLCVCLLEILCLCVLQSCVLSDAILCEFAQFKGYLLLEEYLLFLDQSQTSLKFVFPPQTQPSQPNSSQFNPIHHHHSPPSPTPTNSTTTTTTTKTTKTAEMGSGCATVVGGDEIAPFVGRLIDIVFGLCFAAADNATGLHAFANKFLRLGRSPSPSPNTANNSTTHPNTAPVPAISFPSSAPPLLSSSSSATTPTPTPTPSMGGFAAVVGGGSGSVVGAKLRRLEEEGGKASNLDAFVTLHNVFVRCLRASTKESVLRRILALFSMAPENYENLSGMHTVASFVGMLDTLDASLQDSVLKLVEFTVTSSNRDGMQELSGVCCLLLTRVHTRTLRKVSATVCKLVSFDSRFAVLLEQVGLLDILIMHMKSFVVQQRANTTPHRAIRARARKFSRALGTRSELDIRAMRSLREKGKAISWTDVGKESAQATALTTTLDAIAEDSTPKQPSSDDDNSDGVDRAADSTATEVNITLPSQRRGSNLHHEAGGAEGSGGVFDFDCMAFDGMERSGSLGFKYPTQKPLGKELKEGTFTLINAERFNDLWDMFLALIDCSPTAVEVFRASGGQHLLIKLIEIEETRKGALHALHLLANKAGAESSHDIDAFLEMLQGIPKSKIRLRLDMLVALLQMMSIPHVRTTFRENHGFEACVATLSILEGLISIPVEEQAQLVEALIRTITAALEGHEQNRRYFRSSVGFAALSQALQLINPMQKFNPWFVCNLVLDLAVELVQPLHLSTQDTRASPRKGLVLEITSVRADAIVHHPEAVALLFDLLPQCPREVTIAVLTVVADTAQDKPTNLAAFFEAHVVSKLLEHFSEALMDSTHILHHAATRCLLVVGSYSLSLNECRKVFRMLMLDWQVSAESFETLARIAANGCSAPYFHFTIRSANGSASASPASLAVKFDSSKPLGATSGFTIAFWVHIDRMQPTPTSGAHGNAHGLPLVALCAPGQSLSASQTSSLRLHPDGHIVWVCGGKVVNFEKATIPIGAWTHMFMCQSKQRLGVGATLTIMINGQPMQTEKSSFGSSSAPAQSAMIVGCDDSDTNYNASWRLCNLYVIDEPANPPLALAMFLAGRAYHGNFQHDLPNLLSFDAFETVCKSCSQMSPSLTQHTTALMQLEATLNLEKLVAVFTARDAQTDPDGERVAFNIASEQRLPVAVARGSITFHDPSGLADSIRKLGGVGIVLVLLDHAPNSSVLRYCLELLRAVLTHNHQNYSEMERINGWDVLAASLADKAVAGLVTSEVMRAAFDVVGSDDMDGRVIANVRMFETVILDFNIWGRCDISVQNDLFSRMIHSVVGSQFSHLNVRRILLNKHKVLESLLYILSDDATSLELCPSVISFTRLLISDSFDLADLKLVVSFISYLLFVPTSEGSRVNAPPQQKQSSAKPLSKLSSILKKPNTARTTTRYSRFLPIVLVDEPDSPLTKKFQVGLDVLSMVFDLMGQLDPRTEIRFDICGVTWTHIFIGPNLHPNVLVVGLKILGHALLTRPTLAEKFRIGQGFGWLRNVLPEYRGRADVIVVLLCIMLGVPMLHIPPTYSVDPSGVTSVLESCELNRAVSFPDMWSVVTAVVTAKENMNPCACAPVVARRSSLLPASLQRTATRDRRTISLDVFQGFPGVSSVLGTISTTTNANLASSQPPSTEVSPIGITEPVAQSAPSSPLNMGRSENSPIADFHRHSRSHSNPQLDPNGDMVAEAATGNQSDDEDSDSDAGDRAVVAPQDLPKLRRDSSSAPVSPVAESFPPDLSARSRRHSSLTLDFPDLPFADLMSKNRGESDELWKDHVILLAQVMEHLVTHYDPICQMLAEPKNIESLIDVLFSHHSAPPSMLTGTLQEVTPSEDDSMSSFFDKDTDKDTSVETEPTEKGSPRRKLRGSDAFLSSPISLDSWTREELVLENCFESPEAMALLRLVVTLAMTCFNKDSKGEILEHILGVSPDNTSPLVNLSFQYNVLKGLMQSYRPMIDNGTLKPKITANRVLAQNISRMCVAIVDKTVQGIFHREEPLVLEFVVNMVRVYDSDSSIANGKLSKVDSATGNLFQSCNRMIIMLLETNDTPSSNQLFAMQMILDHTAHILGTAAMDNDTLKCMCHLLLPVLRSEHKITQTQCIEVWKVLMKSRDAAMRELLAWKFGAEIVDYTSKFALIRTNTENFLEWFNAECAKVAKVFEETVDRAWTDNETKTQTFKREQRLQLLSRRQDYRKRTDKRLRLERDATDQILFKRNLAISESINVQRKQLRLRKQSDTNRSLFVAEQRAQLFKQLSRERAIWGPEEPARWRVWELDFTEGPMRIRKRIIPNRQGYVASCATGQFVNALIASRDVADQFSPLMQKPDGQLVAPSMSLRRPSQPDNSTAAQAAVESVSEDTSQAMESDSTVASVPRKLSNTTNAFALPTHANSSTSSLTTTTLSHQSSSATTFSHQSSSTTTIAAGAAKSRLDAIAEDDDDDEIQGATEGTQVHEAETNDDSSSQAIASDDDEVGEAGKLEKWLEPDDVVVHRENCERVVGLDSLPGLLVLCSSCCYFIDYYCVTVDKDGFQMVAVREEAKLDGLRVQRRRWEYGEIRDIHKRRFLLRSVALELFLTNGQTHMLVFETGRRDPIFTRLTVMTNSSTTAQDAISNAKQHFVSKADQAQKDWRLGKICNFEYLMLLNTYAGRTYNDLTQYPVFPWVLCDYTSETLDLKNPAVFRDLSKPMGAQSPDRLESFITRYDAWEDGDIPPFHYGSHYSVAGIVLYYLIRLEPFTSYNITLQGTGRFDHSDRLFHSVYETWQSASGNGSKDQMSDVKELIPEFFFLPDFLENKNNLDLGTRQSGTRLDHVVLPPWAKGSTREFVRLHRLALESEYVTAHLHEWIDLVFGYKQTGKEAVAAYNVFYHLTYEGAIDVDSIEDPVERQATISQITHFGQTPQQLFKKPHKPMGQQQSIPFKPFDAFPDLFQGTRLFEKPCDHAVYSIANATSRPIGVGPNRLSLPPTFTRALIYGRLDRSLAVISMDGSTKPEIFENVHNGVVTVATLTSNSQILATGSDDACVSIWRLALNSRLHSNKLRLLRALCGHTEPITSIAVSQMFSIVVSGSADNTCIIWDLNRLHFIRQLPDHGKPVRHIAIDPQTGDIITAAGGHLFAWTVNGEPIADTTVDGLPKQHCDTITSLEISHTPWWTQNRAVAITGHENGLIKIWRLEIAPCSAEEPPVPQRTPARVNWLLQPVFNLRGHQTAVTALKSIDSQGVMGKNQLVSGDRGGLMLQWSMPEEKEDAPPTTKFPRLHLGKLQRAPTADEG